MAFLLALASSVLYGTADFRGGFASRRAAVVAVTALSQAAGLALLLAALPFVPGMVRASDLAWAVAAGLTGSGGVVLLYRALALGTVSAVAPLVSLVAIAVPVAVGLAAGERPGGAALTGIALGAAAVVLLGRTAERDAPPSRESTRVLPIAIASGVLIGGFLVCIGRIGAGCGLLPLVVARGTGTALFALLALVRRTPLRPALAAWPLAAGCAAADVSANVLFLLAAQRGAMSVVATIVSLAPASTVLLAQLVLRERLARAQQAGVVLALVAVGLLARGAGK